MMSHSDFMNQRPHPNEICHLCSTSEEMLWKIHNAVSGRFTCVLCGRPTTEMAPPGRTPRRTLIGRQHDGSACLLELALAIVLVLLLVGLPIAAIVIAVKFIIKITH